MKTLALGERYCPAQQKMFRLRSGGIMTAIVRTMPEPDKLLALRKVIPTDTALPLWNPLK